MLAPHKTARLLKNRKIFLRMDDGPNTGSTCLDLAYIAAGRLDGFVGSFKILFFFCSPATLHAKFFELASPPP